MRPHVLAALLVLLIAAPAAAQTQAVPEPHPYGLDPYKPSDAAILRAYGSTLVAQTPLLELTQLDPYKPSHAALLRQLGGGMPLWSHLSWYPTAPAPAPLMMVPPQSAAAANAKGSNVVVVYVQPDGSPAPRVSPPLGTIPTPPPPAPRRGIPLPAPGGPLKASVPQPAAQADVAAAQP